MKVGFCLNDHQHVNGSTGPATPVYNDAHGRAFCQKYNPDALSVWEGVSAGWRDLYDRKPTFQWVDVTDVQPGMYWLREDVDPNHVVIEARPRSRPAYANSPTTVPGYNVQPIAIRPIAPGKRDAINMEARRYGPTGPVLFRISTRPAHGTLNVRVGALLKHATVIYRPKRGYHGPDSFSYSAQDEASSYAHVHCQATVSLSIGAQPRPKAPLEYRQRLHRQSPPLTSERWRQCAAASAYRVRIGPRDACERAPRRV